MFLNYYQTNKGGRFLIEDNPISVPADELGFFFLSVSCDFSSSLKLDEYITLEFIFFNYDESDLADPDNHLCFAMKSLHDLLVLKHTI